MTKEKQCAMDKRGTISIKLTPAEAKMFKNFLRITTGSMTSYLQDNSMGTPQEKAPIAMATMVALRVFMEITEPCKECDEKKEGEADVVKKIDIN